MPVLLNSLPGRVNNHNVIDCFDPVACVCVLLQHPRTLNSDTIIDQSDTDL
jgi:hypothetical protein